jgi:RNA polymerase sigma factor (sigma-70 family)
MPDFLVRARTPLYRGPMVSANAPAAAGAPPAELRSELRAEENPTGLDALAAEALGRDPVAVRRFLEAIVSSVRSVCRPVLGPGHPDLEDTIQECLIEILRALPKYRFEGTILGYTNRIALRAAIATRKRGWNREQRARALADQESSSSIAARQDTLPDLWLLRRIIDELPTVQAEAIVMRMVLGCSVEEIAAATRVSVNTSKSRLRVAKDYVRRRLDGEARWGEGDLGPVEAHVPFTRFAHG